MLNSFDASKGQNVNLKVAQAEGDFAEAIKMSPRNAYLYFNRGNLFAGQKNYERAIADYTHSIELDPRLAEAYFNRAIVYGETGRVEQAQKDLSKAGELGLYNAYSLSKQLSKGK